MDTSETYIKMCEKAEPDLIFQTPRLLEDTHNYWASRGFGIPSLHPVWLPRQDQLQEMVGGFEAGFIDWREWKKNIYPSFGGYTNPFSKLGFTSFEQLWLAFVMKEKYDKVWNGERWE